mmetsp:Transcript_8895/g.39355  ORF Transcript_8895/g.39355 Transcript_8895/m.39355 type:complete len:133 (+) Transcript_8895:1461-1859(+)
MGNEFVEHTACGYIPDNRRIRLLSVESWICSGKDLDDVPTCDSYDIAAGIDPLMRGIDVLASNRKGCSAWIPRGSWRGIFGTARPGPNRIVAREMPPPERWYVWLRIPAYPLDQEDSEGLKNGKLLRTIERS